MVAMVAVQLLVEAVRFPVARETTVQLLTAQERVAVLCPAAQVVAVQLVTVATVVSVAAAAAAVVVLLPGAARAELVVAKRQGQRRK